MSSGYNMESRQMSFTETDTIADQLHGKYAVVVNRENTYHGDNIWKFAIYAFKAKYAAKFDKASYAVFWR